MASAKTWFVQTGFGTVLGPMPDDALQEMIRTGALVRSDQVREGVDNAWCSAAEIPGLFAAASADSFVESSAQTTDAKVNAPVISEPPPTERNSTESPFDDPGISKTPDIPSNSRKTVAPSSPAANSTPSIKGRLIPPPPPSPSVSPLAVPLALPPVGSVEQPAAPAVPNTVVNSPSPGVSAEVQQFAASPRAVESPVQPAPPEEDILARWREERDRTREELGAASLAAEMEESHDEEDFAPELPADLLDDEDAIQPVKPASMIAEPQTRRREIHRPALLDQVVGLEDGPRVCEETFLQKWDRWRRSLPSWPSRWALLPCCLVRGGFGRAPRTASTVDTSRFGTNGKLAATTSRIKLVGRNSSKEWNPI